MDAAELCKAVRSAANSLAQVAYELPSDTLATLATIEAEVIGYLKHRYAFTEEAVMAATKMKATWYDEQLYMPGELQRLLLASATKALCPLSVEFSISRAICETSTQPIFMIIGVVSHPMHRMLLQTVTIYGLFDFDRDDMGLQYVANVLTDCWDTSELAIGFKAAREELKREAEIDGRETNKT